MVDSLHKVGDTLEKAPIMTRVRRERRKGLRSALLLVTDPFGHVAALGFGPR